MAICPKCGRYKDTQIHVPQSESKDGIKRIRCDCCYVFVYKVAGCDEQKAKELREQVARSTH